MKRPLLVAAVLAAAPLMAGTAKADPLQMFNIVTPSAGVVNFSGTGTANFNQSLGTNNSINLGSSTNVGVNASASSTSDYTSSGSGTLDLDGSSRLQQTIGTATSAFNASTNASAATEVAHTRATEVANSSSYGTTYTSDYDRTYSQESGWELSAEWEAATQTARDANTGGIADRKYSRSRSAEVSGTTNLEYQSESQYKASSERAWKRGWDSEYSKAYTNSYSTSVETANAASEGQSGSGVIVANFKTTETGNASSASAALTSSFERAAAAEANYEWGYSYDSGDDRYESEADYDRKWEASYQAGYSAAYSAANASGARESISEVEVQGIGSISDVNSKDSSTFQASSDLLAGVDRDDSVGNGSASAAVSLGTSSSASANNATTASAFMQAFSGGGMGASQITNITGDETSGYDVTSETVTTVETNASYSVDADGNVL